MICPTCSGQKETLAMFVLHSDGTEEPYRVMPCQTCRGTGEVSDSYPDWQQRAEMLRKRRKAAGLYFSEAVELSGFDAVTFSRMERGLDDPTPLERVLGPILDAREKEV